MSNYPGYRGKSLTFLKKHKVVVGDSVKVFSDSSYIGILMPRYEYSDDNHIVLKLENGYNVGLEIKNIKKIESIASSGMKEEKEITKPQINSNLPRILLISTGGTIASKIDYRTGGVRPMLTADELNTAVPELIKIANIETQVLFSEPSEDLLPEHWNKIAKKLDSYANSDYKGIIIAHGTDTMHYTAAALSFALSGFPIPIVLVGSQRSSDRPSSDAALNLIAAARFIVECTERGIYIVMHDNTSDDDVACHLGTRVRKNHTSKRDAFQTIGGSPAFLVKSETIMRNFAGAYFKTKKYAPRINWETRVALIKYYPGLDPKIIDYFLESGYRAIIFEGTGLGHVGKIMYEHVGKAKKKGLFLGMTSQCIDGTVSMTVYESGRDLLNLGVVPLSNMISETALVKAMWALANTENIDEMEKLMKQNIASEYSD